MGRPCGVPPQANAFQAPPRVDPTLLASSGRMLNEGPLVPLSSVLQQLAEGGCDPTRRKFCAAAGAGIALLALPACGAGEARIGVGAVQTQPPGAPAGPSPDLASAPTDLGSTI